MIRSRLLVLACVGSLGCGGDLTLPPQAVPAAVAVVKGNGQTGTVGEPLADSLIVRVVDVRDDPVTGQRVAFVPGPDDAEAVPDTAVTDEEGYAAARWVLGTDAGPQSLEARVVTPMAAGGLVASFTADALAGPPDAFIEAGGQDQTGLPGETLPEPLVVRVDDEFGNPVPDVAVNWVVARGGGEVSESRTLTGADGRTSVTWTLGIGQRRQTVEAALEDDPGETVTFTATATAGF